MAKNHTSASRTLGAHIATEAASVAPIDTWAARSTHWLAQSQRNTSRLRREREESPLFLTGHGLSIRVDKGCLVVRDGHTHYPTEDRIWRFFNGALDIPPTIVIVDGSGEVTMDALDWMSTQNVSLIRLRWDGQFISIVTAGGQAASPDKVYWQERTRKDPTGRIRFATNLIREKAHYTVSTMENYVPRSEVWDKAHAEITARMWALERRSPPTIERLLGIEGIIASNYFRAWSAVKLKWKALNQHPVPNDWQSYTSRSALRDKARSNRGATHPVNAMLNYAYGVLVARIQVQLIADGYDPTLGILHDRESDRGNYPAYALDHMEPMRPVVDRAILQLIDENTFSGADFTLQHDGVCRLNPELARRVAQMAEVHYRSVSATAWQP